MNMRASIHRPVDRVPATPVARRGKARRAAIRAAGLLASLLVSAPGAALTINGTFDGSSFIAVPYYTCGPAWNCADASTHSASVMPTADWVVNAFNAAARYWEQRIADPWTVNIEYGFGPSPGGTGHYFSTEFTDGRVSAGRITFNQDPWWFLSANPGRNDEYQPLTVTRQNLPGGAAQSFSVTTGLATAAIPFGPASVPTVLCGTTPCGARQDLMSGAIHELAHALNLFDSTLGRFNQTTIRSSDPLLGVLRIPSGPLAGTLVPWTDGGGGHPFLKPSPGATPFGTVPAEYSDPRLDAPSGDLITNGFYFYGAHRRLVSDLDAAIVALVSDFRRVNLTSMSYVALPDFADTTTLRPEAGGQARLLTVNGAADLAATTDGAGSAVTALRLTPDAGGRTGSAFLTRPFNLAPGSAFESRFSCRAGGAHAGGPQGSDGFAFVLHADPRGSAALGNGGEALGFGSNPTHGDSTAPIVPSLAIEFDTHQNGYDRDGNHIAVILNGNVAAHRAVLTPGFTLNDGQEHFVWVDYDPRTQLLELFLASDDTKPDVASLTESVDLSALWGPNAYFGFSAATGGGFNYHDILSWDLRVAIPTPGGWALLLAGAIAAASTRARRAPAGVVRG